MKEIFLEGNQGAFVNDSDFESLNQFQWRALQGPEVTFPFSGTYQSWRDEVTVESNNVRANEDCGDKGARFGPVIVEALVGCDCVPP
jgi:hypothetical protein